MKVDNFKLIGEYVEQLQLTEDEFLFGQIMVRKKDGSRFAKSNNQIIKDLVFRKKEDFETKKDQIVAITEALGARVYINLNPRKFSEIAIDTAGVCLDYIRNGSVVACRSAFSTACGKFKAKRGTWVVDIDKEDLPYLTSILSFIPLDALVQQIPTVNGVHIITTGFDSRKLKEKYSDLDIHKNNPTLLYF